jgi:hypothetical protein
LSGYTLQALTYRHYDSANITGMMAIYSQDGEAGRLIARSGNSPSAGKIKFLYGCAGEVIRTAVIVAPVS